MSAKAHIRTVAHIPYTHAPQNVTRRAVPKLAQRGSHEA